MDRNDRQAIDELFEKLGEVERRVGPRDPEAETLIRQRIAQQPGAAYYMAQTIVVQEQALNAAQNRIQQLEQQGRSGSFLGGLFGGQRTTAPVPRGYAQPGPGYAQPYGGGGFGGGGFLAGAAQTALGVAGGVLIADLISDAFSGPDQASQDAPPDGTADADDNFDAGTGDFDGGGGDFGGDF